jgi:hypothetical protein
MGPHYNVSAQVLVDQGHQSNLAPLGLDEVVAPDMIAMLRPQADARSVVQPEPAARSLLPGYFKSLTAADPLDTITAELPAGVGKQRCDPTIPVSSVLGCQRDNRSRQSVLISSNDGGVSLCPAALADNPSGMAFGEAILLRDAFNRLTAPFGAYKFPEATSFSTCFSSD